MIVYGELLFLENMIIGGVLLYLTGEICAAAGGKARNAARFRLAAGAVMCGAFSLVIFLNAKAQLMLLMEAVFAMLVCMVSFGDNGGAKEPDPERNRGAVLRRVLQRLPWKKALTFLLVTYFMGGVTMALLLATDNTGIYTAAGIYTGDMKAGWLALFTGVSFGTVKQIIRTVKTRKFYEEHVFTAIIAAGDETVEVQAFLDTGNSLRDPVSGRPAAVARGDTWRRMKEKGLITENRFCIIPYETVGGKGMLTAVRTDYVEVKGRRIKGALVAREDAAGNAGKAGSATLLADSAQAMADVGLLLSRDMI